MTPERTNRLNEIFERLDDLFAVESAMFHDYAESAALGLGLGCRPVAPKRDQFTLDDRHFAAECGIALGDPVVV